MILLQLVVQHALLHRHHLRRALPQKVEILDRAQIVIVGLRGQPPQTDQLDLGRHQLVHQPLVVGMRVRRVELDEHLAPRYVLPFDDMDFSNHAHLQWLDGLRVATGDDLPVRRGDNVDPPDPGPRDRDRKKEHNAPCHDPARRRRRRLLDLQRGGQELTLDVSVALSRFPPGQNIVHIVLNSFHLGTLLRAPRPMTAVA